VLEGTFDPDSAVKLLPRDGAGNIDWIAAQRRGIMRPRAALPGRSQTDSMSFRFGYDFLMKNADTTYDVSFAHSTHAELLSCGSCHPRLFPYRGTKVTMDDLGKGAYCAACHDKVAFPVETGCERCHTRMPPAEGGAKPVLLGTSTLARVQADTTKKGKDADGLFAGLGTDQLPASRFPHWVHRVRYACKVCHTELFVPKAGANAITMKLMSDGKACGACHDGKNAFGVTLNNCDRCHTPAVVPTTKK
jgi:c(7)-type cytochrome triheme protein